MGGFKKKKNVCRKREKSSSDACGFHLTCSTLPCGNLTGMNFTIEVMGRPKKERTCIECGKSVPDSRTDRLYCCDACKNRHNYETRQASRKNHDRVLGILTENYRILTDLLHGRVESVGVAELLCRGFSPKFMTFCQRRPRYSECCCFDIRYNLTDSRIFSISRIRVLGKIE